MRLGLFESAFNIDWSDAKNFINFNFVELELNPLTHLLGTTLFTSILSSPAAIRFPLMALTVFAPPRGTIISINCLRSALCKFDNYVEGERKKSQTFVGFVSLSLWSAAGAAFSICQAATANCRQRKMKIHGKSRQRKCLLKQKKRQRKRDVEGAKKTHVCQIASVCVWVCFSYREHFEDAHQCKASFEPQANKKSCGKVWKNI